MPNEFENIEIPNGCLIAKQDTSFTNQFVLTQNSLNPNAEIRNVMDQPTISNIINVMVAFNFNEIGIPEIKENYNSLNEFKALLVKGISDALPCAVCPLYRSQCSPELYFDKLHDVIRVIPKPTSIETPIDNSDLFDSTTKPTQNLGYYNLPLAD